MQEGKVIRRIEFEILLVFRFFIVNRGEFFLYRIEFVFQLMLKSLEERRKKIKKGKIYSGYDGVSVKGYQKGSIRNLVDIKVNFV